MSVLFIFILSTICVSCARSDPPPCVICEYVGTGLELAKPYTFEIADVPDRCDVVIYGEYDFDFKQNKSDACAINELTSAGKTVYMFYNSPDNVEWEKIIKDPKCLDAHIAPMLANLKENDKISGVILGNLGIVGGIFLDYATIINKILLKIKECVPSIKIGLVIEAFDSFNYKCKDVFDFTVIDANIDFYVVNLWSIAVDCYPNVTATGGRLPVKSGANAFVTLEQLCKDITDSPLDQSKLVVNLIDEATMVDDTGYSSIQTYSDYCSRTNPNQWWCADTMQILYDQVIHLKKCFKGILISYLDTDDFANTCECGKFPVANTQIDAFEGKPFKNCEKIGLILQEN